MIFPPFLTPHLTLAQQWLQEKRVTEIEFSSSTYQVLVQDPLTGVDTWVFLQLNKDGGLRDAFCSCDDTPSLEEEPLCETTPRGCPHLATAWLRIFNNTGTPLHCRFENSLWHHLCCLYAEKLGDTPKQLKSVRKGDYSALSPSGKNICRLKAKTAQAREKLHALLFERQAATEETSIKFSNLSHEELLQWRLGHSSPELVYELSFWSDLAKWALWLQEENEPYQISFLPQRENKLPSMIVISFNTLQLEFYLSEAHLPSIIPSLKTVNSPLRIIDERQQGISSIIYHPETACLEIIPQGPSKQSIEIPNEASPLPIGDWLYIPEVGFIANAPHKLLEQPLLKGEAISELFREHLHIVTELLKGCSLHAEPIKPSYRLEFDSTWNLHIDCYLLEPGDLSSPESVLFGEWAYIKDDGFYRLEQPHFSTKRLLIPEKELPEFIARERSWLNRQKGFHIHISKLEEQLSYSIDENNTLRFHELSHLKSFGGQHHDFGCWSYITDEGFYTKSIPISRGALRGALSVSSEQIPLFIQMHKDELQQLSGFFSTHCPVIKSGYEMFWKQSGQNDLVKISPHYEFDPSYAREGIRLFGEYTYIDGEGFCELKEPLRLPENYRHPVSFVGDALNDFFRYQYTEVTSRAFHIDRQLKKPSSLILEIDSLAFEEDCYQVALSFRSELGSVKAYEIWKALQRKKKFHCSDAGLLELSSTSFDWLRTIRKQRFNSSNTLLLSSIELIRLQTLADIPPPEKESIRGIIHSLTDFRDTPLPPLKQLKSVLRPYQQLGLHWLWFLYQHQLSGLLCDDMGLGKTHQAMALIDIALQETLKSTPPHVLIICPTSVLYHWQEKLQKFLPDIPVITFYGIGRTLALDLQKPTILLTSYGIARNESQRLTSLSFALIIFDEIQVAKNHKSRIYSALQLLQGHMRLGMTGTPIENHLRELKALFDLTLPSYLPGESDFRDYFIRPIEKEDDEERKKLLSKLIKPFVLRRKKEEVLTDLPPKIEETRYCPLLLNQCALYNEVLQRQKVVQTLENGEGQIPYMHIFSVLSALKQICDHPAAYLKEPENYKKHHSGKWNLFLELLEEARCGNQKVVVFSHYLAMLDIMARHMKEENIGFSLLQGSTRDRALQVRRFQEEPSCEVFLGSLQAAGTGIDLTAATVVIHYDRWWNAAKERQATDRAYRIGQLRGVQVFKLVTKDSFEERIDAIISSKAKLEEIVTADEHQILKRFDRKTLIDLLKEVSPGGNAAAMDLNDQL